MQIDKDEVSNIVSVLRDHFNSGITRSIDYRREALSRLKREIILNTDEIITALKNDFNKSPFETYATEIAMVIEEIDYHIKHLKKMMKIRSVKTSIINAVSKSFVIPEPFGVVLIIAPWNYPFQLLISPLIGAISSGNCALVKPAEYTKNTSSVLDKIIKKVFSGSFVACLEGGREVNELLLRQKWDLIFFTGSPSLGKLVMKSAAENLTPVILELGGKSPCIVNRDADLLKAADRIIWGKLINAGQTCVAPDHLLVHEEIYDLFLPMLVNSIKKFYGEEPLKSVDLPSIINDKHFARVSGYLKNEQIYFGGKVDSVFRKIEPTILIDLNNDSPVMKDEIFGPILPVLKFKALTDIKTRMDALDRPLALYYFGRNKADIKYIFNNLVYGGGCINDTIMHVANNNLPFGGVGNSGFGYYHGKASFEAFTHYKSILSKSNIVDIPLRYPPYRDKVKMLMRLFGKL